MNNQKAGEYLKALEQFILANKVEEASQMALVVFKKGYQSTDSSQTQQFFKAAELI